MKEPRRAGRAISGLGSIRGELYSRDVFALDADLKLFGLIESKLGGDAAIRLDHVADASARSVAAEAAAH